jgi:SAM-dependent methyltransferase
VANAYREDLAYIHDAGFGFFARNASLVLLESLRRKAVTTGVIVELGCGSGIMTEAVSTAGYDVLGFDLSEAMISLARKRAPKAQFRQESFLDAELPPCIAVTAIGEVLNFLFDHRNTMRRLRKLVRRAYAALGSGGLFLLDVAGPGRVPRAGRHKHHAEGDD